MSDALKLRLLRGELCKGTFVLFSSGGDFPLFLAGLGFDYYVFDLEHSAFDFPRVRETILRARAGGISAIVRVPELSYAYVARTLDAGAAGIMLPRVEDPASAATLARWGRYPPEGERGISTFAGHNDFTQISDVPAFLRKRNEEVMLIVQIETRRGVENREAILSTPGIDACFIGTGDLAMDMGHAGQTGHPEVLAQVDKVIAAAAACGKIVSLPIRQPQDVAPWIGRGLKMVTLATDGALFSLGAGQFLAEVAAAGVADPGYKR